MGYTSTEWNFIIGLSGLIIAGFTFGWKALDAIVNWSRRPRLTIEYKERWNRRPVKLGKKTIPFHCLIIRNNGKRTAEKCTAILEIISPSDLGNLEKIHKLHWADKDYSYRTDEPEPIEIGGAGQTRRLDVFFSQQSGHRGTMPLYPSGARMEAYTSGQISSASSSLNSNISVETENQIEGMWIAVPIALQRVIIDNQDAPQEHLAPGDYQVKVSVQGDGCCKGDEKIFTIHIGQNATENNLSPIDEG